MLRIILGLSLLVACTIVDAATVKREDFVNSDSVVAALNAANAAANTNLNLATSSNRDNIVSPSNQSPVYSISNGYNSHNSQFVNNPQLNPSNLIAYSNPANPLGQPNSDYVDNVASAGSNVPTSANINNQNSVSFTNGYPSNQGNLYYYYYPIVDKAKENGYQIQAAPSNQYSSAVQPNLNTNDEASSNLNQNNAQQNSNSNTNNVANVPQHDLNYGGQDLSSLTSGVLNENTAGSSGNNYENQLSNFAHALSHYGFNQGSNSNFNNQFTPQLNSFNGGLGQNFGEAFGSSIPQPSSVQSPFGSDAFAAALAANQLSGLSGGSPVQSNSGSSGTFSQLYQQAAQMYQGLVNGGSSNQANQPYSAASTQNPSYEPSTGSSYRSKYGLGTIIMPMLALAGLSLLIPTVTSLSTVASRKKRSTEDSVNNIHSNGISSYLDRIERYYSVYKSAVEREECMNRILCELGDAVSNVRGKATFFTFVEKMVPNWMGNKVNVFKNGALNKDNAKCKKYNCH